MLAKVKRIIWESENYGSFVDIFIWSYSFLATDFATLHFCDTQVNDDDACGIGIIIITFYRFLNTVLAQETFALSTISIQLIPYHWLFLYHNTTKYYMKLGTVIADEVN